MGKKRIIGTKEEGQAEGQPKSGTTATAPTKSKSKRSIEGPIFVVEATYNNTKASITDKRGNIIAWSSAGALGFKGAKKGTPFAAAKVGELLGDKAGELAIKEVDVVVSGVGSGRESSIRGFISKGINVHSIKDVTPVPHNGPKPKKPRRV